MTVAAPTPQESLLPRQSTARPSARRSRIACRVALAALVSAVAACYEPPHNEELMRSPWPTMHRNAYAQASAPFDAPTVADHRAGRLTKSFVPHPTEGTGGDGGGVSPWSHISTRYPDGSRVIWQANRTQVWKLIQKGDTFELVDNYNLVGSFTNLHWQLILLASREVLVLDNDRRAFFVFSDDPADPWSEVELVRTFAIDETRTPGDLTGKFNVTFDGHLIYLTQEDYLGAIRLSDWSFVAAGRAPEGSFHNNFTIDENGGIYVTTPTQMVRMQWDGSGFSTGWTVDYDSTGPTINGTFGSGTTPTLMGTLPDEDRLVLIADAGIPSHLVAFWRDEVPPDWEGVPGFEDRPRIAAVQPLETIDPAATGWSVENSLVVRRRDVAVTQYNGPRPQQLGACSDVPGVEKHRWNPRKRRFELVWANRDVAINSVATMSAWTGLVYGVGLVGCTWTFQALDWRTGLQAFSLSLGTSADWGDGGVQQSLSDDCTFTYGTFNGTVRVGIDDPDRRAQCRRRYRRLGPGT